MQGLVVLASYASRAPLTRGVPETLLASWDGAGRPDSSKAGVNALRTGPESIPTVFTNSVTLRSTPWTLQHSMHSMDRWRAGRWLQDVDSRTLSVKPSLYLE